MKFLNILLALSIIVTPFSFAHTSGQKPVDQQVSASYEVLSQDEMGHVVGGLSTGQLTIVTPAQATNVSNDGWVAYQVHYEIDGEVDFVLFAADNNGSKTELARVNSVTTGTGNFNGQFLSSKVKQGNSVIVAELINHVGADPYDSCETATDTIYARSMRKISGNGQ
jgi:hypothetical protein